MSGRWQVTQLIRVEHAWGPDDPDRWMPCGTWATKDQAMAEAKRCLSRSKTGLRFGVRDLESGAHWEVDR